MKAAAAVGYVLERLIRELGEQCLLCGFGGVVSRLGGVVSLKYSFALQGEGCGHDGSSAKRFEVL